MLLWLVGCLRQWEGTGRVYPVSAYHAWEIAQAVLHWYGADIIDGKLDQGYMFTSEGRRVVSVAVESVDTHQSKVSVSTIYRGLLSSSYYSVGYRNLLHLTEESFHKDFSRGVEFVKAGKPLPVKPPSLSR
jgi:hypothetical protein